MARTGSLAAPDFCRLWLRKDHWSVAHELVLPVGHDAIALVEARGDDSHITCARAHLDVARLGRVVGGHGPGEQPAWPALYRRGRHHEHVWLRLEQQPRIYEVPRPEPLVLVCEHRLEADGRRGLINRIVD